MTKQVELCTEKFASRNLNATAPSGAHLRSDWAPLLAKHGVPSHHAWIAVDDDCTTIWASGPTLRGAWLDALKASRAGQNSTPAEDRGFANGLSYVRLYKAGGSR